MKEPESNRRILIVDDNPSIHADFQKLLATDEIDEPAALEKATKQLFGSDPSHACRFGFQLSSAYQGQEALLKVQEGLRAERPFGLAFVDVRMPPGWDGLETTTRLWEADPELQIVICTAFSDYSWHEMSQRLGASDRLVILKKPFDAIEVVQLANALTEKWRLARAARQKVGDLDELVRQRTQQLQLQSAALTAAENGIVITDPKGVILWHNPAFSQLTGFSLAEIAGQKMSLLKSGKHSAQFYAELWRTISSGRPWHGEITNRRRDGRLFTSEATITPIRDLHGVITHYVAIQHDITARKQDEARIQAFATLGKRLSIASTTLEAARIIVEVADTLLGWDACYFQAYSPADNLVSDILVMDLVDGRRTECKCDSPWHPPTALAGRAVQEGGILLLRDNPIDLRTDGIAFGDTSRPSASILCVPILNGNTVAGVLSIQSYASRTYDNASLETLQALADHCGGALDRIKAQEDLRQTQELLRQSQKLEAIGQLAGGVAHDFNNLLLVIRGNADLVLMNPAQLESDGRECLREVTNAVDRAAKLTNQLLIFSRKQVMQSQTIDLNELVGNLTKMLRRVIGEHINLQCNYGAQSPFIFADAGMIEQVLVNLVVNARDAMTDGGNLVLSTGLVSIDTSQARQHQEARPGQFTTLSVQDSGTGIPPNVLPRIFEPFFTTKDVGKGTGLGLSTVYGIVKQHNGWIEVSSRLGAGSVFTVFFPALEQPQATPTADAAETICVGGSERILLVEDEMGVRDLTRKVLERFGYRVREAASGGQALEEGLACARDFELLLTDMVMPGGITGRDLAERLRVQNPALKVLFTSGYSGDALGQDSGFLRRAGTHFIPKPCSAHQLLKAVRQCLDERYPASEP